MKCRVKVFGLLTMFFCLILIPIKTTSALKPENYLLDKVIYIDPGHGGYDDGACYNGILEDEVNLKISLYLYELLFASDARVFLTRDGDYDLASDNATNRKKEDMSKRVYLINKSKADILVSIHLNAFSNTSVNGAQVFYYENDTLAKCIQNRIQTLNENDKQVKKDDYYILEHVNMMASLVECGFVTGDKDCKVINTSEYQKEVARLIYQGISDYFSINTKQNF